MGILRDGMSGELSAKKAYQEDCKPDYEKQIQVANKRLEAATNLRLSLFQYLETGNRFHGVSNGLVTIIGELDIEILMLEHTISELMAKQERD